MKKLLILGLLAAVVTIINCASGDSTTDPGLGSSTSTSSSASSSSTAASSSTSSSSSSSSASTSSGTSSSTTSSSSSSSSVALTTYDIYKDGSSTVGIVFNGFGGSPGVNTGLTSGAYEGTECRQFDIPANGDGCNFAFAPVDLSSYESTGSLNFYIKSATAGPVPAFLMVRVEGTGPVHSEAMATYLPNFDGNWQLVTIPMSALTGMAGNWATCTVFGMMMDGGAGSADVLIDYVYYSMP